MMVRILVSMEHALTSVFLYVIQYLGCTESEGKGLSNGLWFSESGIAQPLVNGAKVYKRIFIKQYAPSW